MKKCTKSRRPRQPRSRRSKAKRPNPMDQVLDLRHQLREALMEDIRHAVASTARQLVEDEVLALVGAPWSRKGASPLRRGGACSSQIFLDGEPLLLERTRVRDREANAEHPLQSLRALQSRDALDQDVKRLLIRGVSTRNYEDALTSLSDGLGLQKSAVSSAFVRASQKDLDAPNGRPLGEWTFAVVYLDGVVLAEHTALVAMGITLDGHKRILGVREGASENAALVMDLLANLQERGLELVRRALFVVDGSKALRKAIRETFGSRVVVQRCIVHKLRNVLSYLPPKWETEARRRLNAAWGMNSSEEARDALAKVVEWLRGLNESAAASLEEGLEETLTVHRLAVEGLLRRTLLTTNPIESAIDVVRTHARRVKRWSGSSMVLRWMGSGLLRAENQFRRVKGHRAIPQLIAALENLSLKESKDVA